ncbi:transcription initiation factor TFIID subunit 4B [Pteronotus mesoamericanus]|uniref:transcription initiation factor TFIID subunit 4B n=1 Tax=Pteronotus mesoamericanus TaxID=1884717 RepID=UPI0023ED7C52|nr:transcription initiation factor TFIID subunit 4B [Pteronotus parnellii mesoamericanus]XP_054439455.1 transcription initiation factor TFIID subunit 4B [Pteronotus parnellii mesoamericanus]
MSAGLTEPAGAVPPAGVTASGTLTGAPAGTLPTRVGSTSVALGAVTKAPANVCVESTVSQPLRSPVGALVTKVAPVNALPKLSSGPRLPAPQIVTMKAPNTTTIQLPANLQLPPGTVLIKSNSGQLMLVSPQQAVTRAETAGNIISRPAVPTNTQTVKICTMPNSNSQLIKKVAVAPVKQLAPMGTTVVTTAPKPSTVQSVAVPTSVVTVTPVKPLNTVTTLNTSSLGASHTPLSEPNLKAENSAAVQINLSPTMLENVKKCKNFLAMLIKLACSGSQSPEMGQNVKKLVGQLLDAKIEAEEFTRQLYVELKSSPQPHLIPFLKKSVSALRQLMPNSQSFIQQCVQQTSGDIVIVTCTTPVTTSVVTTTVSSIQSEKPVIVSGTTTPRTVSVQSLNSLAGSGGAKTGVVTLHSVGPAAVAGGTTAETVLLQTPKPLVTSIQTTVTDVSLHPEKPVVSGAGVTLALPSVTIGETSASALCLPSVKPVVSSAGISSDKPVIGAPVQIQLTQPGPILPQPAGVPQAVKVRHLVVQQPSGGIAKQVATLSHSSALTIQKSGQKKLPVNTAITTVQSSPASILKQITLPGNKILSLQGSSIQKNKIKENGTTSLRDEDDFNDVTSMAGVNLSEENACILATNSDLVGTLVQSCKDEPFLFIGPLQKRILDIGKRHDITELNSDAVNLISHATQERLRGLLEKLTTIAQHRMTTYKTSENYSLSSDTRSQLKFLEQLDQLEKQRKDLEERELLFKAAKSRSNKEDPEQLRLKQKAKELQQLELAQIQQRDANLTALAAIGPRKKRPLESVSGNEGLKDNSFASGISSLTATKQLLRPRITRICLRDLIFCMEQEREMKYSRALYLALLK